MKPDKLYFDELYSLKGYKFKFGYDRNMLKDILKIKTSGKVLDFGCGEGGLSLALAERGFKVTCIDISKAAIEGLQKEAIQENVKIKAIVADLEDYTIQENYDVILANGILQFFGDKGLEELKQIQKHTQKGGINVVDVFLGEWIPYKDLKEIYSSWEFLEEERYRTKLRSGNLRDALYFIAKKS